MGLASLKFFRLAPTVVAQAVEAELRENPLLLRLFCEAYGDPKANRPVPLGDLRDLYRAELFSLFIRKKIGEMVKKKSLTTGISLGHATDFSDLLSLIADKMLQKQQFDSLRIDELPKTTLGDLELLLHEDVLNPKGPGHE